MPVKHRNAKGRAHVITPEIVKIYREVCRLEPIRRGCAKPPEGTCEYGWAEQCPECERHYDLGHELYRVLQLRPWQFPLDCTSQEPPGLNAAQCDAWWTQALEDAVAEVLDLP